MWNLSPFYLDLAGVYATHDGLKGFDHFLCCPIDGMRRRDQCVVDRQRRDAFVIRCPERTQYQFAVDAHQTNADIGEKRFADLLVAIFDSGENAGGIGTVCPNALGKGTYGRTSVRGIHRDVEPGLYVVPGIVADLVGVPTQLYASFAVEH